MPFNIVDIAILGLIAISVLYALHGGFLNTLLNFGTLLLSFLIARLFMGTLASGFKQNEAVMGILLNYTEGASRIDNLELARSAVSSLSQAALEGAVQGAAFPHPFDTLLLNNLLHQSLIGQGCVTLADYFNTTLVNVSLNILSFVFLFAIAYLIASFAVNAWNAAQRFPVLRSFDMLAAGCLGFLRGITVLLMLFVLVPVALAVLPVDLLQKMIDGSSLAPMFYGDNPVLAVFRGI